MDINLKKKNIFMEKIIDILIGEKWKIMLENTNGF